MRARERSAGWRQRWRRCRHLFGHSLRWRLAALFMALALGTTAVFLAGSRQVFSTGWRELARPLLADYIDRAAAEIGSPPDVARAQALVARLPIAIRIEGPLVRWSSHADRPRRWGQPPGGDDGSELFSRRTADGHVIRFGLGDWHPPERPVWAVGATLAGLLGLTALAFVVVRRLFRPLDDIRAGTQRYGRGDFSQPIPQRRPDELGELAGQVNAMAAGLQRMLEGQRGLLLAISHELRSPLTRARLNAELVADGPERNALLRDLAQMRDLISDLLESERLAQGGATLQREPTEPGALIRSLVDEQFAAALATQRLQLDLAADLPMLALDRARMRMLLRNLIDNGLRHGAGSLVRVCARAGRGVEQGTVLGADSGAGPAGLRLEVRDHGPGVEPGLLQRLAQPFFRPDAARSRERGGVGLGLYLCRLVAESHGGRLELANADPGLRVTVTLPVPSASA